MAHSLSCGASQVVLVIKNLPSNAGDIRGAGSIPGSGKSPEEGNINSFEYSCLENPHGQGSLVGYSPWVTKNQTWLKWLTKKKKKVQVVYWHHNSVQFCSVAKSCLTLCDPMNRSTPGLLVYHQLPKFTQTHVHWVGDAIQPSHPLSFPSPPAFNLSQHQGLFQRVTSSHQVAKVLEFQLQHQSFQWILRTDL